MAVSTWIGRIDLPAICFGMLPHLVVAEIHN